MRLAPAILTVAVIIGGLLVFSGCSSKKLDGPVTIRWVVDPNPARKDQIALFERLHPHIRVNLDPDAGSQKVLTQLAGRVYPDLFAIYDPATISVFARKGVLVDLGPLMKANGISIKDFWPQLAPYITRQGKVCGLPENCGPYVLFYNKRLFREAGVPPPHKGWTWDDLLAAARRLTIKDQNGRTVQFGIGYIEPWIIFWQYGAHYYSPDGKKCVMDSPECKAAARYWASYRLTEHVTPTSSEEQGLSGLGTWGGAAALFKSERVAMQIQGRWLCAEYRKNKDLDWDVAPVPQRGAIKATLFASKSYAIPKGCKNTKKAFIFLKHLLGQQNQVLVAATGDGIPSIRKNAFSKEFLYNPRFPNERNNRVHLDEMQYARSPELSPYISELDATAIFNEEMDMMWQRRQSPEEACTRIARRVTSIIRRNIANPNLLD